MAHIRKHPKTNKWQVRYVDPWRKDRSKTFAKKVDAEIFKAEIEVAKHRGEYLNPDRSAITVADWAAWWLESRVGVRKTTLIRDESCIRNHLLPILGSLRLADLSFEHAQVWVRSLESLGLAPPTVKKAHQLLGQMLDQAVRARRIRWNPARGVEFPKTALHDQRRFLTMVELEHLAQAIDPRYQTLVLLVGYTGMRWGEAAALKIEDLDFLRKSVSVERTLTEVAGRLSITHPKTPGSMRRIALPAFLIEEVAVHIAKWPPASDRLVFTAPEGGPLRRTNFRRRYWLPAIAAAGIDHLRFHDLRHSHASMLIAQGEHPKLIADRLGHASPNVTMSVYSHLFPGLDIDAADRLDAARAKSETDPRRTQQPYTVVRGQQTG